MNLQSNAQATTMAPSIQKSSRRFRSKNRIVLALDEGPHRDQLADILQREGHSVVCLSSPDEARRFARKKRTRATFLAEEYVSHESGWLTCAKIRLENPGHHVVIVGTGLTAEGQRMAEFVGACQYIPSDASIAIVQKAIANIDDSSAS